MEIEIKKLKKIELDKMGVFKWPVWEKEISSFDWHYDGVEECFFLNGKVIVEIKDGKKFEFGEGDFVVFPKGLNCRWNIKEPVKKHYNFK